MTIDQERQQMMDEIEAEIAFTHSMTGLDHFDKRVMEAMRQVPREQFVPPDLKYAAFRNGPLPVGYGQTISQPYIVALMTELLHPEPEYNILEIGTGSGYQTAILSLLCKKLCTLEVIPQLSKAARQSLHELGYRNIELHIGNGYLGWPPAAPYDGIIVTAAADQIPPALLEQLKPGGRLVIPVGQPYGHQELMLVEKDSSGKSHTKDILGVAFVPMVHSTT